MKEEFLLRIDTPDKPVTNNFVDSSLGLGELHHDGLFAALRQGY